MSLVPITTHEADGLARLLEQSRSRPNLTAVLSALLAAVQTYEGQLGQVSGGCAWFGGAAQGAQLDGIGALVGCARGGLSDAAFAVLIAGTIGANSSQADNESLIRIAQVIFQATGCCINNGFSPGHSHARAPAVIGLELGSPQIPATSFPAAIGVLLKSLAAGVALSWVTTYDSASSFALAGTQAGLGLADANVPGSGGTLASSVFTNPVA